ncbi:hypothetical protein SG26_05335 [Haloarcula sp. CBA1115]|uniref:hypothetical protein n=1 Tax=unclassified Haloarcula TaxID=2624677 RepID=UPI0005955B4F|nr:MULTISPECIES: hypothetical protein [unclassified Haloarcula]AJF25190.1 hypothetical protein SG26_05335 [Haloarcula sp. CBA1115]
MRRPSGRRTRLIARTELRRTWRKLKGTTRGALIFLGGGLGISIYSLAIGAGAFFFGGALADSDPHTVRLATTAGIVGLLGLVGFFTLQHTVKSAGEPDAADGLLTTVPYEDAAAGLLAAEAGRVSLALAIPIVALVGGLAAGDAGVLVALVVLVGSVAVALLGTVLGFSLGLVTKLVANRSAFVASHRASVGAAVSLILPLGWVAMTAVPTVQLRVLQLATQSPLSWPADVVLLVLGTGGNSVAAVVATAGIFGALPVGAVACLWLAGRAWYADPVQPDHEFDADERTLSDRLLAGRVPTATRVVAQKSWLRAKRAPVTVQFAVMPFFFLVYHLQIVILERVVPPTLPLSAGLASAAAFGAAFSLNPLGGEEGVLPLTLTANVSGRAFVAGLVLAGALPGVVVTTLLVVGLGIAAGTPPVTLAVALSLALVATLAAPAIAVGTGVVFPKFESSSVQGREVVVPSGWAFGLYFLVLGVAVAPGSLAYLLAVRDLFALPVDGALLLGGGLVASAAIAVAGAVAGFLYAANRVATYRLD